jgi:hypothetical protein
MSGTKVIAVSGIAQASAGAGTTAGLSVAAIATGAATLLGLTALVAAAGVVVGLTGQAMQAYQDRVRQQREAAERREREIQQRIADIRAQIRSRGSQAKVTVKLPPETQFQSTVSTESATTAEQRDKQRKINELNSRLANIKTEYQVLIDQQLLDRSTVDQALKKTKEALNNNNLAQAQGYIQALDDARIQAMKGLQEQWLPQIEYIEQRLAGLRSRIPQALVQELQTNINGAKNNWQQLTQAELDALHQQISTFEGQADSIQQAAEKLAESYRQEGYAAYLGGIDNGDAVVEVETHEGVNTQIRLDFYGQQMALEGPPEQEPSCAARTVEALRRFREQGYQLEWTEWDGEPVAEDLRHLYSVASEDISDNQGTTESDPRSQRRRETQGY